MPKSEEPGTYFLSFVFSCKVDCRMTIYLLTTETIDQKHLTLE